MKKRGPRPDMVIRNHRHGHAARGRQSPEYLLWCAIIGRCYTPTSTVYAYYGGRGIRVADEWRTFEGFLRGLATLGPKPSPEHSIDRIRSDGDYAPGNIRWATKIEQARNQRNNTLVPFAGLLLCISAWAERVGLNQYMISKRLRRGWSPEDALTTPALTGATRR